MVLNMSKEYAGDSETQIKLSIIIPVYNVARYLTSCINSIISEDSDALEIVLIDDGSIDGSAAICDRFALRYSNIRVLHQDNLGVSAARNSGLELALGEYVWFVDGDDLLVEGSVGKILQALEKLSPNLLCFAEQIIDSDGLKVGAIPSPNLDKGISNGPLVCEDCLYPHSHVFKKKIASSLRFDTSLTLLEDRDYFYRIWTCAGDSIFVLDEPLYCYRTGGAATALRSQTCNKLLGAQKVSHIIFKNELEHGRPDPAFESYVLFTSMALSALGRARGRSKRFDYLRDELIGYGMAGRLTTRGLWLRHHLILYAPNLFIFACKINACLKSSIRRG